MRRIVYCGQACPAGSEKPSPRSSRHCRFSIGCALFVLWLSGALGLGSLAASAAAQTPATADVPPSETAPPRSVSDIIMVLDQYKPDPAAIAAARATLAQPAPQSNDPRERVEFHFQRGLAARRLGDDTGAIADLRKARELLTPGDRNAFTVLGTLATAEFLAGNPLNAIETLQQRLRLIPRNASRLLLGHERSASLTYARLGEFEAARTSLRNAERAYEDFSRTPNASYYRHNSLANLERARATLFAAEGKLAESEAAMRKALREDEADQPDREVRARRNLPQLTEEGAELGRGAMYRGLANTLRKMGRGNEAEINIRRALRVALENGGRFSAAAVVNLQIFSSILVEQGRPGEAVLMAREALRSVEGGGAAPHSYAAVNARRALGAALVADSKWGEANDAFLAMRKATEAEPELAKGLQAQGDIDWAHALLKLNRIAPARAMLQTMLERRARVYGDRDPLTAQVRGFHAVALAKSDARAEALSEFARSVPILIEQVRNEAATEAGSGPLAQRLSLILEAYIALLADMHKTGATTPGLDPIAESFRLADVARGSEVQRALSSSAARANIDDPVLGGLARSEQDTQRRIASLSDILRSLLSAPPAQQLPAVIAQMRKDVEGLTAERAKLKREIERRFPDYAELVDPKPVTLAAVQAALRAQETLISIYAGEDTTFVWAVPKSGKPVLAAVPLGLGQLSGTVEALRRALNPQATNIAEIPRFDVAAAARLYEALLKPVEAAWKDGSRHLLVVPHRSLGQLPFGLLPTSVATLSGDSVPFGGYRRIPWLIRETALTQLPSVSSLTSLRSAPAPRGVRRMYMGIGDPFFSKEQATEPVMVAMASTGAATATSTRGYPLRLRSAPRTGSVASAELAMLPRLPDTFEELTEIARTLGADPVKDLLLRRDASEKNVMTLNLSDRRIIHFATHGLVPGELNGLTQPALALTSPDVAGGDGDGLLTMDEILGLKLAADWVVLSACNTASGDGAGSEAVSGLGRAFFYAGARALLVSNWPVDSLAARVLMTDTLQRYVANPAQAKAESLRQAMIAMIDSPGFIAPDTGKPAYSYAHPLFWAPFVLVGD